MQVVEIKNMVPMSTLLHYLSKYPKFFKTIDKIYHRKDTEWDKARCYCPVGLALAYVIDDNDIDDSEITSRMDLARLASRLAVLSSWRQTKSIYYLDDDLAKEFMETAEKDISIPANLLTIPEWCIYIKVNIFKDCQGFFVMLDDDKVRGNLELYIVPVDYSGNLATQLYLPLPRNGEKKLSEIMKEEIKEAEQIEEIPYKDEMGNYFRMSRRSIKFVINFLLYISSVNSEIRVFHRKRKLPVGKIGDTSRDVAIYHVGEETGYRIRKLKEYTYEVNESQGGHHKSPAIHIRRAHWHTFLYGEKKKKRKVKWLPPIIVGANGEEIKVPTITEVKD